MRTGEDPKEKSAMLQCDMHPIAAIRVTPNEMSLNAVRYAQMEVYRTYYRIPHYCFFSPKDHNRVIDDLSQEYMRLSHPLYVDYANEKPRPRTPAEILFEEVQFVILKDLDEGSLIFGFFEW